MCAFFPGRSYKSFSKFSKGHMSQRILRNFALCRTELWLPRGMGVVEQRTRRSGLADATITYEMDKQGPTVQHRGLYSVPCDKP